MQSAIRIKKISSPEDFITILHEVGHVIDDKQHPEEKRKYSTMEAIEGKPQQDRGENLARMERNAWAEALKIAREYDLPIGEYIRKSAQESLVTYQVAKGESLKKYGIESGENFGFTNEKRKELRNQELKRKKWLEGKSD